LCVERIVNAVSGETLRLGLAAGEASGDLLAAQMLAGLVRQVPVDARGIAGPSLIQQGMQAWHTTDELSVRGYVEVIKHLPRLLKLRKNLANRFINWKPDVFVGVDAPDFNIELERRLRAAGIKTVHFIGPSVWAWRYERIQKVKAAADHVMLVFPFEKAIYDKEGIAATYVGHPLADTIALEQPALTTRNVTVALLPGSRLDEINAMAATFLEAASVLAARHPSLKFILPAASAVISKRLNAILASMPKVNAGLVGRIQITEGDSHGALAKASVVLVASGTATLEAALFKKPMVIAYKMPWLSYRLMKGKGYLPYIGLPNILANAMLVPELIQDAATPIALADALESQLLDSSNALRLVEEFSKMHLSLRKDCAARAAQVLLECTRKTGS
jgi:lipid-A-disaccharide synthase